MFSLIWRVLVTAIIGYLLGSINFAVILTRIKEKKDIREMGSGNAGFTNVLRSVGVVPAILTITFDFLKGVIAALIGWWIFSSVQTGQGFTMFECVRYGAYIGGVCAIIGHSFPIYFGFRGGKGIVTAAAMMAVVDWRVFLMIITSWLIMFLCVRIVSLVSMACAALYPAYTCLVSYLLSYLPAYGSDEAIPLRFVFISTGAAFLVGAFCLVKHKDNFRRLCRGEEKRLKAKQKS